MKTPMDSGDETDFYNDFATALKDDRGRPVKTLVIGSRVYVGGSGPFIVRNGLIIENDSRQVGIIKYNTDMKIWVCTIYGSKESLKELSRARM